MTRENMVMSPEHYHEQMQAVRRAVWLEAAKELEDVERGHYLIATFRLNAIAIPFSAARLRNEPWLMGGAQPEEGA